MAKTSNLGDDIQAWPAWKFWGTIDAVIERDTLEWWYPPRFRLKPEQKVALIANGWYTHNPEGWLPPSYLVPLFVSVHISPEIAPKFFRPEVLEYLSQFEIGARDLKTLELLKAFGLNAYFSGCLTLTISHWLPKSDQISGFHPLIIDLDQQALEFVPKEIKQSAVFMSQKISKPAEGMINFRSYIARSPVGGTIKKIFPKRLIDNSFRRLYHLLLPKSHLARLTLAEARLRAIANASLVVTSRLHVALPAASLGVPVVLVHPRLELDPRFSGLRDYVNGYSLEEFKDVSRSLTYDNLRNPNQSKLDELKQALLERLKSFRDHLVIG